LDAGIEDDHLFDEGRTIVRYVRDHFSKYGQVPDSKTIETDIKFIVPELSEVPEPIGYYIDRIKERALDRLAANQVKKMLEAADRVDTPGIVEASKELLTEINRQSLAGETIADWTHDTDNRWADYEQAKITAGGVVGIPTPWNGINDLTQGILPGDFWILVARPGCGKTWHLVKMAVHAWQFEKNPLFVSLEMTRPRIERRMDAAYARLDFRSFKRGQLGMHIEDTYKQALDSLKGKPPLHIVTRKRVKTVADVAILIEQLKPGIVFIDGIYKLRPSGSSRHRSHWERIMDLVDEMQELGQEKDCPILGTTQFSREQAKKGGKTAGLEHIGFADAIGMNADVILALLSDDKLKMQKSVHLKMLKNREDDTKGWVSKFDLSTMDFSEQSEYSEDVGGDPTGDAAVDYAP
jgi:replicative DNA helicase